MMPDQPIDVTTGGKPASRKAGRLLGSLRDALAAAGRADQVSQKVTGEPAALLTPPPIPEHSDDQLKKNSSQHERMTTARPKEEDVVDIEEVPVVSQRVSAKEAAAAARGEAGEMPAPSAEALATKTSRHVEFDNPPTTAVVKRGSEQEKSKVTESAAATQFVRGRAKVNRGTFSQDPVVGWLVVVGGPGLGNFRPVFEGNNTIGRSKSQRIPIDFGDEAISSEEQAYIRYDSAERSFLFVPNLSKTNIVSVNDKRPTGATSLSSMDVITIGRTQLVFVPFCGSEFDWSDLPQS